MPKEVTVQTTDQAELDRTDMIRDSLKGLTQLQVKGLKGYSKLSDLAPVGKEKPLIIRGSAFPVFDALTDISGLLEWDEDYLQKDLYYEYLQLKGWTPVEGKPKWIVKDAKDKVRNLLLEEDAQYLWYHPDRIEVLLNKLLAMTSTKAIGDLHDDDLARKPTTPKARGTGTTATPQEEGQDATTDQD